jgi:catechol 2,3-dioxygenase-like lactoylglutathione lyase family enzyme
MTLHVHHLALRVADLERALAFYAGVLGLPEVQRLRQADGAWRSVWLRAGSAILMLETELKPPGATGGSAHVLAFAVDDLSLWEGRLAAAGVDILDRTAYTLYVGDPDGHRVGLSSLTLPA